MYWKQKIIAESIVQVNGELWDLDRPLEGDCSLELLKFEDEEGISIVFCDDPLPIQHRSL